MIGILRLLWLLVDEYLTVFSSDNESFGVSNNALDVESLSRRLCQKHFVVSTGFKKHDFSLISADYESSIGKPSVASEIVRDMSLFLNNLSVGGLERVVLLNSVELVGVIASNQHYVVILVAEWALVD